MVLTRIWAPCSTAKAFVYAVSGVGYVPLGTVTPLESLRSEVEEGKSPIDVASQPSLVKLAHCAALCNMASLHRKTVKDEKIEQQQRKKLIKQLSTEMDPDLVQSVMEPDANEPIDDSVDWVLKLFTQC
jgi:hypothetical protein